MREREREGKQTSEKHEWERKRRQGGRERMFNASRSRKEKKTVTTNNKQDIVLTLSADPVARIYSL